ncbi:MAG: hypothetical protein E7538_06945 [Ruminococcaceae bacterium]|nr:hypothetical protein [Oscillospiraceae bacterium]
MYPEQIVSDAFTYILNMSITGSYIILAVLVARLLLKKAPKKLSYLLWIAPFFRLVCPFTMQSAFSFFNLGIFNKDVYANNIHEYVPLSYDWDYTPEFTTGITQEQGLIPSTFEAFTGAPDNSANPLQVYLFVLGCVWIMGIFAMLIYAGVTFVKTKKRLRTAVKLEGNVFESENISAPFVMGVFRPKIYLPYGLDEKEKQYIILHEKTHIKSLDHFSKIFAFLVLTVHWFNPLCYLAFALMSRDMEMACDEEVLKSNESIRKDYSSSLLSFASNKRLPSPSPLCFGESGVKQRIKNALAWKKPKKAAVAIGLVLLFICTVAFISNPQALHTSDNIDPALDDAVSQMILEQCDDGYWPYFCKTEGHKIFGYSAKDDEVTVYGYMSYSTMNFMNGYLSPYMGSGSACPFVAVFWDKGGFYKLKELKTPEDGMGYGDSIRELFPNEFERQALNPQKYIDEIEAQEKAYAKSALKEAGIDCEIVPSDETNIVLMTYYEAQEKINSTETINPYLNINTQLYPDFMGVTMYRYGEKYIVYERRADEEKNRYYLAEYENGSTEAVAHAFDLEGNYIGQETIAVKDFFLYEGPEKDGKLYYIYDENKLTTNAVIVEDSEAPAPPEPTTRLIDSQTSEVF